MGLARRNASDSSSFVLEKKMEVFLVGRVYVIPKLTGLYLVFLEVCIISVSYTHLDVYKRQLSRTLRTIVLA